MSWWTLARSPEPEIMSGADEVEAYASAAAQAYLDSVDNKFVEQVLRVAAENGIASRAHLSNGISGARARNTGRAAWLLDVGTGPGGIPLKVARACPELYAVGVDRSPTMISAAQKAAAEQGLARHVFFLVGDASRLAFTDGSFDVVISNSLLHHLPEPVSVFNEMARVVKPSGVVLLRDLCRPLRFVFPLHVRWFGRYYSGLMKKLYVDSVRAAYTGPELDQLLRRSNLAAARPFFHGRTHLGFVRCGDLTSEADRT